MFSQPLSFFCEWGQEVEVSAVFITQNYILFVKEDEKSAKKS